MVIGVVLDCTGERGRCFVLWKSGQFVENDFSFLNSVKRRKTVERIEEELS